jgi:dihydrolipoamide dehydrogenase
MKEYDFVVVGSGCGLIIVEEAIEHDIKVALIDKGPAGGTCSNTGCIPSKMLIQPADRVMEAHEAARLGVHTKVSSINFSAIMQRMRKSTTRSREYIERKLKTGKKLAYYPGQGRFTGDMTLEVNGEKIKGRRIVIASGSRTVIPPVKGLETVDYLTNESVLMLDKKPESLIIIGGGYIAVEFGHFFAAMGTRVTMLEMLDRLIPSEEPEIAALLKKQLEKRMEIHTGEIVKEVKRSLTGGVTVITSEKQTGKAKEYTAEKILVAVGRRSNADLLDVEKAGVKLDERGFIKVNHYMQTNKRYIFAIGDANGQQMFTHVANQEAMVAVDHVLHGGMQRMDYTAAPHAVFSYPQIASVGLTEEKARSSHKIRVGRAHYSSVAYGEAMGEKEGFAKAVVEEGTGKILGFHIIGPHAPILIQEVVNAMTYGGQVDEISHSLHIHPALAELIPSALDSVR